MSIGSSVIEQVQVFNTGSVELNVSSLSLSSASAPFSVQENSFTVAPGGTYGFDITFTPTSAGSHNYLLTLESNADNNSSVSISLSGLGYDDFFNPVAPTGLPYSIIISALDIDGHGLSYGNEIGVFEYDVGTSSDVCVGSYFYQGENLSLIHI